MKCGNYMNWPVLDVQQGARRTVSAEGEFTGMVLCPQRLSHIGVERCGEYQGLFKCGRRCKNAAPAALIEMVREMARAGSPLELAPGGLRCNACGGPRKSPTSRVCASCSGSANSRAQRRAAKGEGFTHMPTEKQCVQVLNALDRGCETSTEVSAATGLSVKTASAWLGELARAGIIVKRKENAVRYSKTGRASHIYQRKPS